MSEENTNPVHTLYYALIDPETRIVQLCYQMFAPSKEENFVQISKADYDKFYTLPGAKLDENGAITPYQPPVSKEAVKSMAGYAMQTVNSQAAFVSAMGATFGPKMKEYVNKLEDILDGRDTTSTELPTAPADPKM